MDELLNTSLEIARGMWRRRWVGVVAAWLVGIAAGAYVMTYPNRYQAAARLYVDTKSVLRPLMSGLVVEPNTEQTALMLSKTLITKPNVERLVRSLLLDAGAKDEAARESFALGVMRRIKITNLGREGIYDFSYMDVDPKRARVVVEALVSMFLTADRESKQRDSTNARQFLDEQVKEYEHKLAAADNRVKEFKLRNLSSASGRDYFNRITALEEELNKLNVELRAAQESRDALRRELSGESATLMPDIGNPESSVVSTEFDARLDSQRKQLDELLRRYTDLHPDVIATRRLIDRLEEQRAADIEAKKRVAKNKPFAQDESAQRGRITLAEAEAQVASLRFRAGDAQTRMNQLRAAANRVPQVEAEFAQLTRDYENARRNYEAIQARRDKAALSEDADASRGDQFRLIDPPRTSNEPIFPSRRNLAPMVVLLALLAGVIASAACDRLLPTFDSAKSMRLIANRPVLGSVSMLVSPAMQKRSRQMTMAFGGSVMLLVIIGLLWARWVSLAAIRI